MVAATKLDLGDPRARGDFREDLYYRLNVVTLRIPPLRERSEDVPLLFARFLARAAERFGRPLPELAPAVRARLAGHDWPGNVRELLHFAERVALGLVEGEEAGEGTVAAPAEGTLPERVDRFEAEQIRAVLREHRGNAAAAMASLGLPKKTFYDKLKRHCIQRADFDG